jgi:hypothetical protein
MQSLIRHYQEITVPGAYTLYYMYHTKYIVSALGHVHET